MRARDLLTDFPTVLEIAVPMAHVPLVAVVGEGRLHGAVTLQALTNRMLAS